MFPASLIPLYKVAATPSWRKKLASTDTPCLVEIQQKKCPLIRVTENHHHAQVPLSCPISDEDHQIGGFSTPLWTS